MTNSRLPGGLASIHHQHMAGDVIRSVGCKEDGRAFKIVIAAKAAQWDVLQQIVSFVLNHPSRHVRGKPAGGYGVHLNVVTRPLASQILSEGDDAALAGMVSAGLHCLRRRTAKAGNGCDVDDLSPALPDHYL